MRTLALLLVLLAGCDTTCTPDENCGNPAQIHHHNNKGE